MSNLWWALLGVGVLAYYYRSRISKSLGTIATTRPGTVLYDMPQSNIYEGYAKQFQKDALNAYYSGDIVEQERNLWLAQRALQNVSGGASFPLTASMEEVLWKMDRIPGLPEGLPPPPPY